MSNHNDDQTQFAYDDGEPLTIEENDLADVSDDVDLMSHKDETKNDIVDAAAIKALPENVHTPPSYDDENVDESASLCDKDVGNRKKEVSLDHDEVAVTSYRGTKRKTCLAMVCFSVVVIVLVVVFVVKPENGAEEKTIDQKIQEEGSPWAFDESDEFGPLLEAIGLTDDETTTDDVEKTVVNVLEKELQLDVPFPAHLGKNFKNINDLPFDYRTDIPFFWQVPNSGSTMQSVMTACTHLTLASGTGDIDNKRPSTLEKVVVNKHEYVNVNLGYTTGITNAASLGLASSGLADVLVSHHLHYAGKMLFDGEHKGRAFTILRHPIERSLATYHALQLHSTNPVLKSMTLEEYIDSEFVESNWLIRFLVNRRQDGVLGYEQVAVAKELLRRKFLIGLYDNLEESIARIEAFFAWTVVSPPGRAEGAKLCHDEMINNARQRDKDDFEYMNTKLQYGDSNYNKLKELNRYDLEVYWYAVQLFKEQEMMLKEAIGYGGQE